MTATSSVATEVMLVEGTLVVAGVELQLARARATQTKVAGIRDWVA